MIINLLPEPSKLPSDCNTLYHYEDAATLEMFVIIGDASYYNEITITFV